VADPRSDREPAAGPATVGIHPVVDEGLGNSAYVVELGDGRALVVDPARDPGAYLAVAERLGLTIAYTLETHLHADFLTGSRELAAAGAQILAPRASRLRYFHRGLEDGQRVDLGGLVLCAMATPGHAPEHLAYLLMDGDRPLALFSGGALLVGAVARTDLISPGQTEPLARAAHRSLGRLLELPDDLAVYPTHGTGSFCSAPAGDRRTTTIGAERRHNRLAAAEDEGSFAAMLQAGLGSYPRYFGGLRERNRQGPELLGPRWRALAELSVDQVREQLAAGATLVDARPVTRFAAGHIPGALSIALRPQFGTWLGWLVEPDRPLVFVLDDQQDRAELVRQCRTIGHDRLVGELAGGMASWRAAGLDEQAVPVVGPHQAGAAPVLDVRQASEVAEGHLPGAVAIELGSLAGDPAPAVPDGPLTVMCGAGQRAMTAASLLQQRGHDQVRVLPASARDWSRATGQALAVPGPTPEATDGQPRAGGPVAEGRPPVREPVIEVLYSDGCPCYREAVALVERVRDEFGVTSEVRAVLIADQEAAERARFPGSPTVRVDGRDVEPGADPPTEITLDCRLYRHPHRLAGQPPEQWVRDALLKAIDRA
jgi:hydroxyacylglutathione hydrolase